MGKDEKKKSKPDLSRCCCAQEPPLLLDTALSSPHPRQCTVLHFTARGTYLAAPATALAVHPLLVEGVLRLVHPGVSKHEALRRLCGKRRHGEWCASMWRQHLMAMVMRSTGTRTRTTTRGCLPIIASNASRPRAVWPAIARRSHQKSIHPPLLSDAGCDHEMLAPVHTAATGHMRGGGAHPPPAHAHTHR